MKSKLRKNILPITIIVISIIVVVIGLSLIAVYQLGNPQEYVVVSIRIQAELKSDNDTTVSTKYLYFCTIDSGETIVFENEDSIFNGKFDSSTFLARLKVLEESGETFKIKTKGYRIPQLSTYQNIIEVETID